MALVAEESAAPGGPTLLGVGRWTRAHAVPEAEFALVVSDSAQHQGLGTELLRRLIQSAKAEGLRRLTGDILPESWAMQRLCVDLGFHLEHVAGDAVRATLDLTTASH